MWTDVFARAPALPVPSPPPRPTAPRLPAKGVAGQRGFTLVEVIVTIMIGAVLGSMLVVFTQTARERSVAPVEVLRQENLLSRAMEDITARYKEMIRSYQDSQTPISLTTLKTYAATQYSGLVVSGETGFMKFTPSGIDTYTTSSLSQSYVKNAILLITLKAKGQRRYAAFTD